FFFFQAEDGIRDFHVTGVQTCALPIFLDKESTATSFLPGTYLGSKSIFNIGAGFYTNKEALLSQPEEGVFKTHDQLNLGIDAFVEVPIGVKEKEMRSEERRVGKERRDR